MSQKEFEQMDHGGDRMDLYFQKNTCMSTQNRQKT